MAVKPLKIYVTGSTKGVPNDKLPMLKEFVEQLGVQAIADGHTLFLSTDSEDSIEIFAAQGASQSKRKGATIEWWEIDAQPHDGSRPRGEKFKEIRQSSKPQWNVKTLDLLRL